MKRFKMLWTIGWKTILGCAIFGAGFSLFLEPNSLNAGGIAGFAMSIIHIFDFGSVGLISMLINLPLFAIAGIKIGKKFFLGSLFGMACLSVFIDLFAFLPRPEV